MKRISHKQIATLPVSVKNRNDMADYDYLDKLNNEELEWLKGFNQQWANANFKHRHTKHDIDTKLIYDANNARNRCLYNVKKWTCSLYLFPCEMSEVSAWDYFQNLYIKEQLKITLDTYSE